MSKVVPTRETDTVVLQNEKTSNLTNTILLLKQHSDLIKLLKTSLENEFKGMLSNKFGDMLSDKVVKQEVIKKIFTKITSEVVEYNKKKLRQELRFVVIPEAQTFYYTHFLRDAFLIHSYGLERFVTLCMSESHHGGWSHHEGTDKVKFTKMTSYKKYDERKATYEQLKLKRLHEPSISGNISTQNPTLLADVWDLNRIMSEDENNFSNSLKSFFTKSQNWFSADKTIFGLLKKFGKYILKNQNIDEIFGDTLNTLFQEESSRLKAKIKEIQDTKEIGSITCKQLFCFALDHCIKLNPLPPSGGGQFVSRPRSSEEVSLNNIVVPIRQNNRSYWKKILVSTFCIMSFIYFTLLLFETYRLLNSTITRILDARVTYLALYGPENESEADRTFVGYINSFLQVMYESAAGNIIETLDSLSPLIMQQLINSLMTVATTATNVQYNTCADGIFGCVNSFFTGESQRQLEEVTQVLAMKEFDTAIIQFRYSLQSRINETKYIWRSGTRNLVTALHGISFSSILMLHILYPQSYNNEIVAGSATMLITAYNTNPLYGLYVLGGQFSLLLYPQIPQINNVEEIDSQLVEQPQASTPQLAITQADVSPQETLRQQLQRMGSMRDTLSTLIQKANKELEGDESRSRGGRKCRTLKKRKYKTMKKKIIKNKRTIRR